MQKFETFEEFIREKFKTQANAARILKTKQNVVSNWVTGRNNPEPEMQRILTEKYGYDGGWLDSKAKAATTVDLSHLLTREEFAEWRGYWKAGTEKLLTDLVDQARRISELEKQVSELLRNSK